MLWQSLSPEVWLAIFNYLGYDDILKTGFVCKAWRSFSLDPSLWRVIDLCESKYERSLLPLLKWTKPRKLVLYNIKQSILRYLLPVAAELKELAIIHCNNVDGTALTQLLRSATNLEALTVHNCVIPHESFDLSMCSRLSILDISQSVTDSVLKGLNRRIDSVEELYITSSRNIAPLLQLLLLNAPKSLKLLDLFGCDKVSTRTIQALQTAIPTLKDIRYESLQLPFTISALTATAPNANDVLLALQYLSRLFVSDHAPQPIIDEIISHRLIARVIEGLETYRNNYPLLYATVRTLENITASPHSDVLEQAIEANIFEGLAELLDSTPLPPSVAASALSAIGNLAHEVEDTTALLDQGIGSLALSWTLANIASSAAHQSFYARITKLRGAAFLLSSLCSAEDAAFASEALTACTALLREATDQEILEYAVAGLRRLVENTGPLELFDAVVSSHCCGEMPRVLQQYPAVCMDLLQLTILLIDALVGTPHAAHLADSRILTVLTNVITGLPQGRLNACRYVVDLMRSHPELYEMLLDAGVLAALADILNTKAPNPPLQLLAARAFQEVIVQGSDSVLERADREVHLVQSLCCMWERAFTHELVEAIGDALIQLLQRGEAEAELLNVPTNPRLPMLQPWLVPPQLLSVDKEQEGNAQAEMTRKRRLPGHTTQTQHTTSFAKPEHATLKVILQRCNTNPSDMWFSRSYEGLAMRVWSAAKLRRAETESKRPNLE